MKMFTEEDSRMQSEEIARLADEFAMLEKAEKSIRRAAGLPEEGALALGDADRTPAVMKALEEARAKAKRDGAERAAKFGKDSRQAPANTAPGRVRRGVVRL